MLEAFEMLEKEFLVEVKHTAVEMGSGDIEVFSTPSMIAFMEHVAKEAVVGQLAEGETTVGIELNVQHVKATAIGKMVRVTAELINQKKSILFFELVAYEGETMIGKGTHKRAIVDAKKFMAKL